MTTMRAKEEKHRESFLPYRDVRAHVEATKTSRIEKGNRTGTQ
jgi:hypothetical protein